MADVAELAGVSHMTVSRVLNHFEGIRPATRDKVRDAIDQLDYRRNDAARRLASARSGLIGVVTSDLTQYGPANILVGIEHVARQSGYRVAAANAGGTTRVRFVEAVDQLLEQAVEALVLLVPHHDLLDVVQNMRLELPVVTVGDLNPTRLTAGVDNVGGARAATCHLLDLGHPNVIHVAGPNGWLEASARAEGWATELQSRGRPVHGPKWIGDWSASSGYDIGLRLSAELDVTAVFAANDQMALGVIRALSTAGLRVPEDVSVVGFGNMPEAAYFTPPLTTVHQPFDHLARNVVKLVADALSVGSPGQVPLVPTRLVIRESTSPHFP